MRLLEAAAIGDVPLESLTGVTGVGQAVRGHDWTRVNGCWVSPSTVRDALGAAVGGLPVHIATDAEGSDLVAYIARGSDTAPTPTGVHEALMAVLPAHGGTGVIAPARYVLVESPPAERDRSDAWHRLPILEEGTGRSRQVRHEH